MRYYAVVLTDPKTGKLWVPPSLTGSSFLTGTTTTTLDGGVGGASYTSYTRGQTLQAAWRVEIDAFVAAYAAPVSDTGAFLRVWGISLDEIKQASNLNNFNISVYGGMKKGLPLATAAAGQAGLLFQGFVQQCFGNWVGTDMTLEFVVFPGTVAATPPKPKNFSFSWTAGTPLAQAVAATLSNAYPGVTQNVNVSSKLVLGQDQVGAFENLAQFAQFVKNISQPIVGGTYPGVDMIYHDNAISVYDGTGTAKAPITIAFQDMVGQPTWVDSATIQVKTVMRSDIVVGNQIKMDPGGVLAFTTPSSQSQTRSKSVFQGSFTVSQIHHVGDSRSPSADAWCTVVDAAISDSAVAAQNTGFGVDG